VVRRILRSDNLVAVRKRKFVVATDSKHPFTAYSNLVQYVRVETNNQLWVADMTYIRLGREFVCMAVVLDVFSRKVVGLVAGSRYDQSIAAGGIESGDLQQGLGKMPTVRAS